MNIDEFKNSMKNNDMIKSYMCNNLTYELKHKNTINEKHSDANTGGYEQINEKHSDANTSSYEEINEKHSDANTGGYEQITDKSCISKRNLQIIAEEINNNKSNTIEINNKHSDNNSELNDNTLDNNTSDYEEITDKSCISRRNSQIFSEEINNSITIEINKKHSDNNSLSDDNTSDYEEPDKLHISRKNSQIFSEEINNSNTIEINENEKKVREEIIKIYNIDFLPVSHINFLEKLYTDMNFKPKVAYDIGSAVFHWTRHSKRIWPDCKIICFDANPDLEFLYKQHDQEYFLGLLSDSDDVNNKYYYNRMMFGGNSMYIENGDYFTEDTFLLLQTYKLDTLVEKNNYPYPDLIKMDTQGSELDIIKGATKVLEHCKYLILELQDIDYNINSPKSNDVIEYLKTIGYICIAPKFSNNNADYDSCFINTKFISQLHC